MCLRERQGLQLLDAPGAGFVSGYYCGDPASDPLPGTISGAGVQATNSCNITQCNQGVSRLPGQWT